MFAWLAAVQRLHREGRMANFETITDALVTVTGGQALNTIPGAWRPDSGMRVPTPTGSPMSNFDRAAAPAEAKAQRGGGGGGGGEPPKSLPLLY